MESSKTPRKDESNDGENAAEKKAVGKGKTAPGKKPTLKNTLGRRVSRNFIELPPLDAAKKTVTKTHMNELDDYIVLQTGAPVDKVPGTNVPRLSNYGTISEPDSRPQSKMENFGAWQWQSTESTGPSDMQTLGDLMKERVYLKQDLEGTMEKLDKLYKEQTRLGAELKTHRALNDKLQEKLQVMEAALERAHQREAELLGKIEEKENVGSRVEQSMAEAAARGMSITQNDLAAMQNRAKELEEKEQEIEDKIRQTEVQEDINANKLLMTERELKESKRAIRQLELERAELERQLAEATPYPPSRLSLVSEESDEKEADEDHDEDDEPSAGYKPKRRVERKRSVKKTKKKQSKKETKTDIDEEERPSSRACVIL